MQINKYLDNLGMKRKEYGTNFTAKDDKRTEYWKQQRKKYGFDERETWNLDRVFVEWLYSRLMMYKETGGELINLNHHKCEYNSKQMTQSEAIDFILDRCKSFLLCDMMTWEEENKVYADMTEAIHIWAEIWPAMWW